jgi:hypothetical protein
VRGKPLTVAGQWRIFTAFPFIFRRIGEVANQKTNGIPANAEYSEQRNLRG